MTGASQGDVEKGDAGCVDSEDYRAHNAVRTIEGGTMARPKPLIPQLLLSSPAFRNDLSRMLGLSASQIDQLDSLAAGPDGFSPALMATQFAAEASLAPEDARGSLRVAEYLYERCRDHRISPEDATAQLVQIAETWGLGDATEKVPALTKLLATKEQYERGRHAELRALSTVAHFEGLEGVWDIRPVFHREREEVIAKVPVLLLNVSWHSTAGKSQEAVFQLNEEDWEDVKEAVDRLDTQRKAVRDQLEEPLS